MISQRSNRRQFLQTAAVAGVVPAGLRGVAARPVAIVLDPADPVAAAPASRWAAGELSGALTGRGVPARIVDRVAQTDAAALCIVASGNQQGRAPSVPEALALGPAKVAGRDVLLATGQDPRGLVYALLDLADRVRNASDPAAALAIQATLAERPANAVRSIKRLFTSEVEDKPWFYDREMWPRYLTMLASTAFNRFNLSFGIGYDFLRDVTDAYFLFAYPFLLSVPGYSVRAANLPDAERDRNLEMLTLHQRADRGAAASSSSSASGCTATSGTTARTRTTRSTDSTPETHGPYCRDALAALLARLPVHQRRHLPHPRRERGHGGQLPFLEDSLRRRRSARRARSRSTCTPKASTQA